MTKLVERASPAAVAQKPESWADRYFRLRNRVLSNPRFQRWAARFPLTRFIARSRASALFDLCAGFVYSQVLQASVQLGLLEMLNEGAQTAAELAPRLSLRLEAATRLLDAAVSLKLAERRSEGRYGLGVHGASFIGNPAVAKMVAHHALLYRDLADPVALLRGEARRTELGQFWSYTAGHDEPSTANEVAPYSELMAGSLPLIAEDILEAYPLTAHQQLLDLAGGEGAFVQAAAAHAPHLKLTLFDLPAVATRARERFERTGLSSRATALGGDLFADPLPPGADVVTLVRVIHDHDDLQALKILRAAFTALKPGGVVLIAEPMAGTTGAEPMGDAYFGFYLLAMGQGRPRTVQRLEELLQLAGFVDVQRKDTRRPMLSRLVIASVPTP